MVETIEEVGFKLTELGLIPEDWDVAALSKVSSMKSGATITSKNIDTKGVFRCYGGNGLRGYTSKYTHDGNFALIGRQGALCGNVQYVEGRFFASEHAIVVTPNFKTDIQWLYYILGKMNLNQYSESSAQPGLSVTKISILPIAIPPTKAEQTAIATALNDADALIAQLEKLIAKKRAIKQGAMQKLLQPKEGWEMKKLGEECELITKGTTPTSLGRDFKTSGINFIKIESLTEEGKIIKDKVAYIDAFTNTLLKRSQIKSNDLLYSIAGALGRVALVKKDILPANTNQALAIIRLKSDSNIVVEYLFNYLNSERIKRHIISINVQGAQANLSLQNISDFEIAIPNKFEQTQIATILSDMDAEIAALEQKLEKYKKIKQGMMQVLLTGKIRLV